LDKIDLKILDELRRQGYQKAPILAPKMNLGVDAVRRRIHRMETAGIFKVTTIPNPVAFGYKAWAQIGVKVELGYKDSVMRQLLNHPDIYFVGKCLNEFDIWLGVFFNNTESLAQFANDELIRLTGVVGIETMQMVSPKKYYHFSWPTPNNTKSAARHGNTISNGDQQPYQPDEMDRKILRIMQKDALIRPEKLKTKLGLGESTTRKRVRNLLNNGLAAIEVIPNPEVIQFELFTEIGIKVNRESAAKVLDAIVEKWDVHFASQCLGRFNIMIGANFHGIDRLSHFISIDLPTIPGINAIQSFILSKPIQYHGIDWSYRLDNNNSGKGL